MLKNLINKRASLILWLAVIGYFVVFSLTAVFKYCHFGYNGLDLAIYNQVFFNSLNGQLFHFTIHPHSYLGDHFELFIILLLPFYYLFQHPLSLLILQSLALALSAWPLFLIAKKLLSNSWALLVSLLWLLNPFIQNINLFEFHLLPFALPLLLSAFYFYLKNKFWPFLLLLLLSLIVREDVALAVFMFSVLAILEKKSRAWIIWPGLVSGAWFIMAVKIIGQFSPAGGYKFMYYYSWLGASLPTMALNFFAHPLNTAAHLFSINNLLFTLLLFLPLLGLCWLGAKYLILALPIYLQLILGGSNNSIVILKLHYTALLLPGLFIALIYGLHKIQATAPINKLVVWLKANKNFLLILLLTAGLYGALTLGPLPTLIKKIFKPTYSPVVRQLKREFLKKIPANVSVAATYEFLTNLSGRPKIYSLHYAFIGKKQFSSLDYRLPDDLAMLAVDFDDLLTYSVQFPNSAQWQNYYSGGAGRIRQLLTERGLQATAVADSLAIFEKTEQTGLELYQAGSSINQLTNPQNINLGQGLKFLGWTKLNTAQSDILPVSLYFQSDKPLNKNYQLNLIVKNKNGQITRSKLYPLAYGLYPTSEWQPGEIVKINYWFLLPQDLPAGDYGTEIQLVNYSGFLTVDGLRSAMMNITQKNNLGPALPLATYSIP